MRKTELKKRAREVSSTMLRGPRSQAHLSGHSASRKAASARKRAKAAASAARRWGWRPGGAAAKEESV